MIPAIILLCWSFFVLGCIFTQNILIQLFIFWLEVQLWLSFMTVVQKTWQSFFHKSICLDFQCTQKRQESWLHNVLVCQPASSLNSLKNYSFSLPWNLRTKPTVSHFIFFVQNHVVSCVTLKINEDFHAPLKMNCICRNRNIEIWISYE